MPLTPEVQIIALGIIGGLLLINLLVLLLRRKNPELRNVADILFRGQAELAGRLTQISEYSRQQQDVIASAINEQRVSVLKIMDEKLLQVAKNVSEGLQQNTVKTNETLTDLRERLAKIDVAQQKISALSEQVVSLQEVLSNKQARGAFGEIQLNDLVTSALPPSAYEFQVVLTN